MLNKKSLIAIVLIAVGGFGTGFFIYTDMLGKGGKSGGGGPNGGAVPDLDRLVIAADISGDARVEVEERLKHISGELKEQPDLLSSWLELGNWRKEAKDYDGVLQVWEFVVSRWPSDKVGYANLGTLYHFYLHDYVNAEKYLKLAIEQDPDWAVSYVNLYELYKYSYTEKADLADDALLDGLVQLPDHVALLYELASYYRTSDQLELAREYFEKVLVAAKAAGDTPNIERIEAILGEM